MDKVALITGGRSGIGLACAQKLSQSGYEVVTAQRTPADTFHSIEADFSDPDTPKRVIQQVIDRHGRLDALVNNAGIMLEDTVEGMSLADWNRTLNINLTAPFLLIKYALPHLQGEGAIVNIGSIEGLGSNPQHAAYCASKAGMNSLTRTLAKTLGKKKIRVNAVLPGLIDGDWAFNTWGGGDAEQYEGLKKVFEDQTPLGHVTTPEDVADAILSIVTGSDYVTGQLVTIDSGFTL